MIIKKIKLYNFVSYSDYNEFEFCHGEKNVTLINAEGGAGKTTLLRALKWCLYGLDVVNQSFKSNEKLKPIDLLNKEINDELGECEKRFSVELSFEKDGKTYKIIRVNTFKNNKQTSGNNNINKDDLSFFERTEDMDWRKEESDPQGFIDLHIPRNLNFFFEGEASLEELGKDSDEIKKSIYNVLGLRPIENAVEDLKSVSKSLTQEYEKLARENMSFQNLLSERDKIKQEIKNSDELKKNKRDEEESLEKIIIKLNEERDLIPEQTIEKTNENQKKYTKLIKELENNIYTLNEVEKKYNNFLSKDSYMIFSKDILKQSFNLIETKYNKNEAPTPHAKEFLKGLLDSGECFCGNKLIEGNEAFERLKELYEYSASNKKRKNFSSIYYLLKDKTDDLNTDVEIKLGDYQNKISKLKDDIYNLELKKDATVTESDQKNIVEKYQWLGKEISIKNLRLKEIMRAIINFDSNIESKRNNLNSIIKKITEAEKKNNKNTILKERKDLAKNLLNILEKKLEKTEKLAIRDLESSIRHVYSKVNGKNLKVELDENFNYNLRDFDNSIVTNLSGSEIKNKALAFVGGLIMRAKKLNKEIAEDGGIKGGIYPLVLDAPYGELDDGYRLELTKVIPETSEQVIIMVNSGQWDHKMEDSIKEKIGMSYILTNVKRDNSTEKYNRTLIEKDVK